MVTFLATNVANIARAAVPPERADDVHVFVGTLDDLFAGRPTERGHPEYDALSRHTFDDLPSGSRALFVAPEWNLDESAVTDPRLEIWGGIAAGSDGLTTVRSSVPDPRRLPASSDELVPARPWTIALSALAALAFLWLVGSGWAWWTFDERVAASAAAPAFGVATITIFALGLERLGVPLDVWWGPALASALAAVAGHIVRVVKGESLHDPPS